MSNRYISIEQMYGCNNSLMILNQSLKSVSQGYKNSAARISKIYRKWKNLR